MITLLLAAQILIMQAPVDEPKFVVQAPAPPSREEAARILAQSPGLSNRTQAPAPVPVGGPRVASTGATGPTLGPWAFPAPNAPTRLDGTPLTQPPTVYGIPYPWDPLSWALANLSLGGPK